MLAIKGIAAVPTILDVHCRTTGMDFAAVARVTEDRWAACSVKDSIGSGLKPSPGPGANRCPDEIDERVVSSLRPGRL